MEQVASFLAKAAGKAGGEPFSRRRSGASDTLRDESDTKSRPRDGRRRSNASNAALSKGSRGGGPDGINKNKFQIDQEVLGNPIFQEFIRNANEKEVSKNLPLLQTNGTLDNIKRDVENYRKKNREGPNKRAYDLMNLKFREKSLSKFEKVMNNISASRNVLQYKTELERKSDYLKEGLATGQISEYALASSDKLNELFRDTRYQFDDLYKLKIPEKVNLKAREYELLEKQGIYVVNDQLDYKYTLPPLSERDATRYDNSFPANEAPISSRRRERDKGLEFSVNVRISGAKDLLKIDDTDGIQNPNALDVGSWLSSLDRQENVYRKLHSQRHSVLV